jgi:hypothetical protein
VQGAASAGLARVCGNRSLLEAALQALQQEQEQRKAAPEPGVGAELARLRAQLDELLVRELATSDVEEKASIARVRRQLQQAAAALKQALGPAPLPPASSAVPLELGQVAAQFEGVWEESTGEERAALVNACIHRIRVAITPVEECRDRRRRHERRVEEVELAGWLQPFFGQDAP